MGTWTAETYWKHIELKLDGMAPFKASLKDGALVTPGWAYFKKKI